MGLSSLRSYLYSFFNGPFLKQRITAEITVFKTPLNFDDYEKHCLNGLFMIAFLPKSHRRVET
jgi:hypothetical protein